MDKFTLDAEIGTLWDRARVADPDIRTIIDDLQAEHWAGRSAAIIGRIRPQVDRVDRPPIQANADDFPTEGDGLGPAGRRVLKGRHAGEREPLSRGMAALLGIKTERRAR